MKQRSLLTEALGFVRFVKRGCESGAIKSQPFVDFSDAEATELPVGTLQELAEQILKKAEGQR